LNITDSCQICKLVALKPTGLSRAMHNAAFKAKNLNFKYEVLDTSDTTLAIAEMREQGIRGYSLTIPHKEAALDLIDQIDSAAKEVGAVNTVVNQNQILTGYNTDVYGIEEALKEVRGLGEFETVLILGAGGAARAAVQALKSSGVDNIYVSNRTMERAERLARDFSCQALSLQDSIKLSGCDLLINSTPQGSHLAEDSGQELAKRVEGLDENSVVFDMVTLEKTSLLENAQSRGLKTVSGPRMLLHQAVRQFELFTGVEPAPLEAMEQALYDELRKA